MSDPHGTPGAVWKLTARRKAETLYELAQRFAHARRANSSEHPSVTLARVADEYAAQYPHGEGQAIERMRLRTARTRKGWGALGLLDRDSVWKRREPLRDAVRRYLHDLLTHDVQPAPKRQQQPQQQQQPSTPQPAQPRAPTVQVIGTIDMQGQAVSADHSAPPLPDGAQVYQLVNAKIEGANGQPVHVLDAVDDPLSERVGQHGLIDYTGEPRVRAALLDALRERRRGRELHGLDCGELDLSRVAPTALGVDLERAYSRRIKPDTRGTAVYVLLDGSGSMGGGHQPGTAGIDSHAARACAFAYRALTRAHVPVSVEQYGNLDEHQELVTWTTPPAQALERIGSARAQRWYTDAPAAVERAARALLRRSEPRKVCMILCDGDATTAKHGEPKHAPLFAAARAGVELWPLFLGPRAADCAQLAQDSGAAAAWAVPPIVVVDPSELVERWTAALRQHLGRIAV